MFPCPGIHGIPSRYSLLQAVAHPIIMLQAFMMKAR